MVGAVAEEVKETDLILAGSPGFGFSAAAYLAMPD
jgi:hypothetical protein